MSKLRLICLIIFNGWGVIYTILGSLMAVINVNQVSNLMADRSFLGQFFGLGANTLIGLVSVIYALAIALIPFIASRIVKGETMLTLIATAYTAARTVPATASGVAAVTTRVRVLAVRVAERHRRQIRLHAAVTRDSTSPAGLDMPSAVPLELLPKGSDRN